MTRMSRQELVELIKSVEEGGGDATPLKALLAEVDSAERTSAGRKTNVPSPGGLRATRDEEMTMQERLNHEVGDLYLGGISDEHLAKIIDMDRNHNQKELQAMCIEAGLSPCGQKKKLAAKLIAHNSGSAAKDTYLGEGI